MTALPEMTELEPRYGPFRVFRMNRDVHGAWVNSVALRLAGIDRDRPQHGGARRVHLPRVLRARPRQRVA